MAHDSGKSPDFLNPPVFETALTVQFDELVPFPVTLFGKFHSHIESDFPYAQSRPAVLPMSESFPIGKRPPTKLLVDPGAPPIRAWYISANPGSELIQLQHDRFSFNWRANDKTSYPRFTTNLPRCLYHFKKFIKFCEQESLGRINPNLCEVMYSNHIYPREGERVADTISSIAEGITWSTSDGWLPKPEVASISRTYVIGQNQGRLYSELSCARDNDGKDFVNWKLTARVVSRSDEEFDVHDALSIAHKWVVWGFCSSSRAEAQAGIWRREQP